MGKIYQGDVLLASGGQWTTGGNWRKSKETTLSQDSDNIIITDLGIENQGLIVITQPQKADSTENSIVYVNVNGPTAEGNPTRYLSYQYGIHHIVPDRKLYLHVWKNPDGSYSANGWTGQAGVPFNTGDVKSVGGSNTPPYYIGNNKIDSLYFYPVTESVQFAAGTTIECWIQDGNVTEGSSIGLPPATAADAGKVPVVQADGSYQLGNVGGGDVWALAKTITLAEDVVNIYLDLDVPAKEIMVKCRPVSDDTNKSIAFFKDESVGYGHILCSFKDVLGASTSSNRFVAVLTHYPEFVSATINYNLYNDGIANNTLSSTNTYLDSLDVSHDKKVGDAFSCLNLACWYGGTAGVFKVGTYLEVWTR